MRQKIWKIEKSNVEQAQTLRLGLAQREIVVSDLIARLLCNRGFTDAEASARFLMKETGVFYDPFLFRDMERAVLRIRSAIAANEKITVYGDYDVDGVTATASLCQYLNEQGADVRYYIPSRTSEGYGLNESAILRCKEEGVSLMITVDTGVTAISEIDYANALGIDVIVTDHHTCRPILPHAYAVINPRRQDSGYPFGELAGVGVVFKLLCAMETYGMQTPEEKMNATRHICMQYGAYAAIGTIADVMPLLDENRLIVNLGLLLLQKTDKPGLRALLDRASVPQGSDRPTYTPTVKRITSSYIGYTIAPRINAAGRIADASRAVELFLTDSANQANRIADELHDANRERQEMENRITEEAIAQVEAQHDPAREHILVLHGEDWHHGVVGIVSSRITERYHLPSVLISFDGSDGACAPDDIGKGSGRSIDGFSLVEGIASCEDLLVKYGGHALAAGLTIKRAQLREFSERMEQCAAKSFVGGIPETVLQIDAETVFSDISVANAQQLYMMEPFGNGNPAPLFCLYGARIMQIAALKGGAHTKLVLCDPSDESVTRTAMLFGVKTDGLLWRVGDVIDVAYRMEINEFRDQRSVQMMISDIRPSDPEQYADACEKRIYRLICEGFSVMTPQCTSPREMIPTREDFRAVYLLLREWTENGAIRADCRYGRMVYHSAVDGCKVRLICDMLEELSLIARTKKDDDGFVCTMQKNEGRKVDLTSAPLMKKLYDIFGVSSDH
ncbi:MAG: single-stranded-DNA-specific exonuclease RecJ [Clostridia bacterium]|nr:single-stranded-DNA-specific exonuclease RecJ [Clostridia bacterium]